MGIPLIDYMFGSDPFELNFRLLVLNGFWPLDTNTKCLRILYSIYSFLCFFSVTSMLFIQILDLYLLRNDLYTFTKNLCASSVTFAAITKHVLIFYKIEDVQRLHQKLKKFRASITEPEDVEIVENSARLMSKTTKAIYGLAIPCVTAWMLYPGLESANKQNGVPFPYRLPTDDWSTPIYEILYTYQSMSMVGFMVVVLSDDLVYYGLVIRINAEYEVLNRKVKRLGEIAGGGAEGGGAVRGSYDPAVTERVRLIIKDCSAFHQNILAEIDQLKAIYGRIYFIHFLAAVILVGVIIIDLILVSKGFQLQMLQRIMYSLNGIFDTFLCCLFTTAMQEKSHKLSRVVYSTPWYELDPKVRKDLLMIFINLLKAPAVRVGNHFPLNLSTFLQFLRMSYNITALLYQTIRN